MDWVQVTFQTVLDIQKICDILGLDIIHFGFESSGKFGYKSQKSFGHIHIMYDHRTVPGYHVMMTGQGCREFETTSTKDWKQFVQDAFAADGTFSRWDAAIDDIAVEDEKPYFTVTQLYRKVKEGAVTSMFKRGKKVEGFEIEDGSSTGETLYFGREQSDVQIRIYEKDHERANAGKEIEGNIVAWNRFEMQCRRDRAQAMAIYLLNSEGDYCKTLAGIIRNYINFRVKQPGMLSNKSMWPLCKWWDDFLGDVEKLKLTMQAPDRTIERTKGWLDKQVAPALGMMFYAYGSDMNLIVDFLNDGLDRMTPEQIRLADEYRETMEQIAADREWDKLAEMNAYLNKTVREASFEQRKIAYRDMVDDFSEDKN
ncbi:replication initiation factor domain-containing protein [Paenibacillus amylolyticus]|uniref:replication initiation factor domain-containing protein n=1 Tax=Paenibacillus amylolyticus TaxID=1451 RepID=UPI00201D7AE8